MLLFLKQKISCPNCDLLNDPNASTCEHCNRVFSESEIKQHILEAEKLKKKSKTFGAISIIFFIVIFVVVAEVFF